MCVCVFVDISALQPFWVIQTKSERKSQRRLNKATKFELLAFISSLSMHFLLAHLIMWKCVSQCEPSRVNERRNREPSMAGWFPVHFANSVQKIMFLNFILPARQLSMRRNHFNRIYRLYLLRIYESSMSHAWNASFEKRHNQCAEWKWFFFFGIPSFIQCVCVILTYTLDISYAMDTFQNFNLICHLIHLWPSLSVEPISNCNFRSWRKPHSTSIDSHNSNANGLRNFAVCVCARRIDCQAWLITFCVLYVVSVRC